MPPPSPGAPGARPAPRLRPGDRVRLVSPASYPDQAGVDATARILASWGLVPETGAHVLDEWGYMAGRDADRLADLNDAFRDPGVRALIATLGGAGAYRIVDGIDFAAVRADPKPVLGFSDITNLHLALWRHCRVPSVHGCLFMDRAASTAKQLLMGTDPIVVHRDPAVSSNGLDVPGRASGFLLGGHFGTLLGFVGAGMPSFEGAILCIEEQGQPAPDVLDGRWHQLIASGALDGVRGVAVGGLGELDAATAAVFRDRLGSLGVPVLSGLPLGHLPDQSCVPLGTVATIDTDAGTLTAATAVV